MARQFAAVLASGDRSAALASVNVPTLVIHGDGDQIVPFPVSGRRMPHFVPDAEVHVISGGPHGVLASHPDEVLGRVRALNEIAEQRGQSLAQMALAWILRDDRVTSTLVGASSVEQLRANLGALSNLAFSDAELARIEAFAVEAGANS